MSTTNTSALFAEVWAEYGISMCTHFLRFYARWKLFGFKNFDIGDAFAALAVVNHESTASKFHNSLCLDRYSIRCKQLGYICSVCIP